MRRQVTTIYRSNQLNNAAHVHGFNLFLFPVYPSLRRGRVSKWQQAETVARLRDMPI
jgi:hypothetical protein